MDDRSYDDTEPTPQPHYFRPPLPSQHPTLQMEQSPNTALLNHHSILSYGDSIEGLDVVDDGSSLPTFNDEPPSPMTRPSQSMMMGSHGSTTAANTRFARTQPPIAEVHFEGEGEEDSTYYDAMAEQALARRTKRSLLAVPEPDKSHNTDRHVSYASGVSASESTSASIDFSSSLSQMHTPSTPGARSIPSHTASPVAHLPSPRNLSQSRSQSPHQSRSQDISSDDMLRVHKSSLDTLMKMKEELMKANQTKEALQREKQALQKERDTIRQEFQTYKADQGYQLQQLKVEKQTWVREKRDFEVQIRTADRLKKDNMHRRLAADNQKKEFKTQLEELRLDLGEAKAEKDLLSSNVEALQKSNESLKEQNAELSKELEEQKTTSAKLVHDLKKQVRDQDEQIEHIQKVAESKAEEAENFRKKLTKYAAALKEAQKNLKKPTLKNPPSYSTDGQQEEGLDKSVTNRLAKMRDSAERAHMIRLHKRELARLKMDKDVQIQKIVAEHEDVLRKVTKDSTAKLNAKMEELRTSLREEYDSKFSNMEKHHNDKFGALQQEYLRSQEDSDEALQVALGKVSEASKEYEKEAARREGAQKTLDQLRKKLTTEKRMVAEKYEKELQQHRVQWEQERETLLAVVQKDCNNAFETHRKGFTVNKSLNKSLESQRRSPTSTLHTFFPPTISVDADDGSYVRSVTGSVRSLTGHVQVISPSESDLESDLKYTEDLIAGLL
ncbi:unnamed protein product [Cylindrotheca closterium]|uniref:Uncharacterized protein n=1 Tax=Cylindrotheca closterium TaxID=2856 RepID=A0AAD2CQ16_9STRA|nr:unnamed protein product [Cylindrotheca closterium]